MQPAPDQRDGRRAPQAGCRENLQRQVAAPPLPVTHTTFPFIFKDLRRMAQDVLSLLKLTAPSPTKGP